MDMDGIYVAMRSATSLVAVIGGERYVARFLFTPAVLRAGDRVWLRIEKMLDGTDEDIAWGAARKASAADVTARITRIIGKPTNAPPVRPRAGLTFFMTIDEFGAVTPGDEATRQRYGARDGGATVVEDEPTEKLCERMVLSASEIEATLQDNEFDIACGNVDVPVRRSA